MSDTEKRLAALEIAIKHVFEQLPPDYLKAACQELDNKIANWQATPVPQSSTMTRRNAMQSVAEYNPNATSQAMERQAFGDALTQARKLIAQHIYTIEYHGYSVDFTPLDCGDGEFRAQWSVRNNHPNADGSWMNLSDLGCRGSKEEMASVGEREAKRWIDEK
ncbi:hypothetical protein KDW63_12235 [Burkholderia cenocepacia]|uniref:hypothetical protein n=1 Tax=Burkholderia cenocepacia TaxID=95486 RepID=UPI001B9BE2C4|nr:hypothetical protein [Burkholderia cenocepacia]MBR8294952.1 hypothetical protein [Burkholderia cenocepacia]